jgi:putative transposase
MTTISFARRQFPPAIIRRTVWLYLHFTLSSHDVEDLLAECGLDVSYESVRRCYWNSGRYSPGSFAVGTIRRLRSDISTR